MKACFSFRLVSVHSAAHHERNRPEGHFERPASRNGPSAGSRRHDAVADHHQHLRAAQKKETQRRQHVRGRGPAPEREEEDPCAHRRWGVFGISTFRRTLEYVSSLSNIDGLLLFLLRCLFLVAFLTFGRETAYTLDSRWTFPIFLILKPCLT